MVKRLVWGLAGVALLAILGFAWTPLIVRSYIERNYPGVRVMGNISLHWGSVTLTNVKLNRDRLTGVLNRVVVDFDKNAKIYGGTLELDLIDRDSKPSTPTGGSITAEGLDVKVRKGEISAKLQQVKVGENVCFKAGTITYKEYEATAQDGCVTRGPEKVLTVKSVEVPFKIPFEAPRMERDQVLTLEGVTVKDTQEIKFESAALKSGVVKIKEPSKVALLEKDVLVDLYGIEVNHPWVSPEGVTFKEFVAMLPKSLREGSGVIEARLGKAELTVDPFGFHLKGKGSCNDWVRAMPDPVPEALKQADQHYQGDLEFEVSKDPTPNLSVTNQCRFECGAEPIKSLRSGRIRYMAYDKSNQLFERTIGPGQKDWVSIQTLPPHIPKAFTTMEDPGFFKHRGIVAQALENSLRDNLKLGKFFRGGSTITMQLAKNLWLRRHKTVGRKAHEALLTIALESCLSKPEILELYLNAIEYGPNLYGIGPAAQHYFDKGAQDLEPEEAFYLASILPRPRKALHPEAGGLKRTQRLMETLADRGFISEELVPVEPGVDSTGWEAE